MQNQKRYLRTVGREYELHINELNQVIATDLVDGTKHLYGQDEEGRPFLELLDRPKDGKIHVGRQTFGGKSKSNDNEEALKALYQLSVMNFFEKKYGASPNMETLSEMYKDYLKSTIPIKGALNADIIGTRYIAFDEIILVYKVEDECIIKTKYIQFISKIDFQNVFKALKKGRFLKILRDKIINMDQVDSYDEIEKLLYLKNHEGTIKVSKNYDKDIINYLEFSTKK